ncbi:MAG TPA: selenocysteine-specific translation elongation factor [Planctomycetota bacterium]|nr:selenocysteine-specific translation elongation factor [Planctomycetota bacterium]HRR78593.1 selenocysteine-specific translation elongation factor [Planctomycetota bacterium]HRT96512.1 selenocysteine-specific translation elongation factor [Planctomycetota bacterium]
MKHLVAGTAGHIDHGKSSLIKALTGIEMDRLPEEKRRGISIELGYAFLDLPDGTRVGLVDVPGHERFVRTMVAGATGIDFAILVVAADDSVMPQTREHLAILKLLAIRDGLVVVNKVDLVDAEMVELVVEEVRELVADTFLARADIVPVSSVTGQGLDALREAIARVAARIPERPGGALARLPIDRSFAIAGHGTVVTGTLVGGVLRVGDEVEVLPRGQRARVRGLQWHGSAVEAAYAGQRTAVNLAGIKHDELERGDVLCARDAFLPTSMVDGRLVLDAAVPRPIEHGASVTFHLGTSEVHARVALLDRLRLEPGSEAWAQLRLAGQVVARHGDRFIVRTAGGDATLGGGEVLDAHPLKHRRQRADAAEALLALANGGLQAAISNELRKAAGPLRLSAVCKELAETPAAVLQACGDRIRILSTGADAWLYDLALRDAAIEQAAAALSQHHKAKPLLATGLTVAALAAKIDPERRFTEDLLAAILDEGVAAGRFRRVENTYALASHRVQLDPRQAEVREAILAACLAAPFAPPTLADLQKALPFPAAQIASVHEALLKSGGLVDAEVCGFHPQAVEEAWRKLEAYLRQHGQITMSDFRQLLNTTRRYALGLMQHFDATRNIVRDGDFRRLRT